MNVLTNFTIMGEEKGVSIYGYITESTKWIDFAENDYQIVVKKMNVEKGDFFIADLF